MDSEKFKFLQPQDLPKVFFSPTLTPIYPLKMTEIKKKKYFVGKNVVIRLFKSLKIKALSALNF